MKCQTEHAGDEPLPIPAPAPIEELTPGEVKCADTGKLPSPEPGEELVESYPSVRTLALYRDNGTGVCYSRKPLLVCKGGLHPYNLARHVVPFVCFQLGLVSPALLTRLHSSDCLPSRDYTNEEHDDYEQLFRISVPRVCVRRKEKSEFTTSPATIDATTSAWPKQKIVVRLNCTPGGGHFTLRADSIGVLSKIGYRLELAELLKGSCEVSEKGNNRSANVSMLFTLYERHLKIAWKLEFVKKSLMSNGIGARHNSPRWEYGKVEIRTTSHTLQGTAMEWSPNTENNNRSDVRLKFESKYRTVTMIAENLRIAPYVEDDREPAETGMCALWCGMKINLPGRSTRTEYGTSSHAFRLHPLWCL